MWGRITTICRAVGLVESRAVGCLRRSWSEPGQQLSTPLSIGFAVGLAATLAVGLASPATAAEFDAFEDIDRVGAFEAWAGADATSRTWFAYSGVTAAVWGDIHADGFRLRAAQGVGGYSYRYDAATAVKVSKSVTDLMIGYQFGVDDYTLKAFAGWSVLARQFEVPSLGAVEQRIEHGFKAGVEVWLDWSEVTWASFDASFAQARSTIDARFRLGQRLDNDISAGPEVVFNRTDLSGEVIANGTDYGNARIGAFVRYDWFGGEISAAGGLSSDVTGSQSRAGPPSGTGSGSSSSLPSIKAERHSPYGSVTVLFQF